MKNQQALCLHAGARHVTTEQLHTLGAPKGTKTHQPIAHGLLAQLVESATKKAGLKILSREYAVSQNKNIFFGLLNVQNGHKADDWGWTIGLRNSHDKSLRAGVCAGSRVFVCDNLMFTGEFVMFRTHTRFIERDLPGLVDASIDPLIKSLKAMEAQMRAFKSTTVDDRTARDLIVRAAREGIVASNHILDVDKQWTTPKHDAFKPRTAFSLINAFTEVDKMYGLGQIIGRTRKLQTLVSTVLK